MGHIFFQTPPPPGHSWSQSPPPDPQDSSVNQTPPPPGHIIALINPRPTMDQIHRDPQDNLIPPPPGQDWSERSPTPQTHCQQNTLPQQDKKVPAAYPLLRIISGTALMRFDQTEIAVYSKIYLWVKFLHTGLDHTFSHGKS